MNDYDLVFDDNLSVSDEAISPEQVLKKLEEALKFILEKRFTNAEKRKIAYPSDRINFACPYCGDSKHDNHKKRGNIYTGIWWFKCYNGDCNKVRPVYQFIKDFGADDILTLSEFNFLKNNVNIGEFSGTGPSGVRRSASITDVFGIEKYGIPRSLIMEKMNLVEVSDNQKIADYLYGRKQISRERGINHFAYDSRYDILYILNLTPDKQNVIGIQGRYNDKKMVQRTKIRFKSYQYSDIWKEILGQEISDEVKDLMNKFSLIYNIMNVNYTEPVYIFEGAIDSHHMHNSMASLSAEAKLRFPNARYFYDNSRIDKAGMKQAKDLLLDRNYVFLWDKFLRDYPTYQYCKDLNDCIIKKEIDENILKGYFSNDPLDLIYL